MLVYFYRMTEDKRKLHKTLNESERVSKNIVLLDNTNVNVLDCILSNSLNDSYNYVYIPSMNRYYFAETTDILSNDRKRMRFTTDYLMSYKDLIDSLTLHFVKSSRSKGSKIDFDTENKITRRYYSINNPFLDSYSDVLISVRGA